MHVDEFVPDRRQPVVNEHLEPSAVLPEVEPKYSCTQDKQLSLNAEQIDTGFS